MRNEEMGEQADRRALKTLNPEFLFPWLSFSRRFSFFIYLFFSPLFFFGLYAVK